MGREVPHQFCNELCVFYKLDLYIVMTVISPRVVRVGALSGLRLAIIELAAALSFPQSIYPYALLYLSITEVSPG